MTLKEFLEVRAGDLSFELQAIYADGCSATNYIREGEGIHPFLLETFENWKIFFIWESQGRLIISIEEPAGSEEAGLEEQSLENNFCDNTGHCAGTDCRRYYECHET